MRHNGEWLAPLTMEQLFELTSTTTVARILERDDFAKRWQAHQPISMLEMLYPLAQGYDSVAVEADIELGGTDQKFNLFMGRDLQQYFGQEPQAIMTLDILPGTDGVERMSKSTGNYIGVTEDPRDIYGKVMSIPDAVMMTYYRLLTCASRRRAGRARDGARPTARPTHATSRPRLAREIITRLHGGDAAAEAEEHFDRVFRRRLAADDVQTLDLLARRRRGRQRLPAEASSSAGSASPAPRAGGASSRAASRSTARRWRASSLAVGDLRGRARQGRQVGAFPGRRRRRLTPRRPAFADSAPRPASATG